MKLDVHEIQELFHQAFVGKTVVVFVPADRRESASWWAQKIAAIEGTRLTVHAADKDPRSRVLCRFVITDGRDSDYLDRADELRIEHDREDRIVMRCVKADAAADAELVTTIANPREVETLVHLVRQAYSRRDAEARRVQLIEQMKANAIRAHVAKLATESSLRWATAAVAGGVDIFVAMTPHQIGRVHLREADFAAVETRLDDLQSQISRQQFEGLTVVASLPEGADWITP